MVIRNILVDGHQCVKPRGGKCQQFSIFDARPTFLNNRGDLM